MTRLFRREAHRPVPVHRGTQSGPLFNPSITVMTLIPIALPCLPVLSRLFHSTAWPPTEPQFPLTRFPNPKSVEWNPHRIAWPSLVVIFINIRRGVHRQSKMVVIPLLLLLHLRMLPIWPLPVIIDTTTITIHTSINTISSNILMRSLMVLALFITSHPPRLIRRPILAPLWIEQASTLQFLLIPEAPVTSHRITLRGL